MECRFTFGDVQFFSDYPGPWEKYWALKNAIGSTNWTNMELRNKFQYVVNVAGGNMNVNCYGPSGDLVSAEKQNLSVMACDDIRTEYRELSFSSSSLQKVTHPHTKASYLRVEMLKMHVAGGTCRIKGLLTQSVDT